MVIYDVLYEFIYGIRGAILISNLRKCTRTGWKFANLHLKGVLAWVLKRSKNQIRHLPYGSRLKVIYLHWKEAPLEHLWTVVRQSLLYYRHSNDFLGSLYSELWCEKERNSIRCGMEWDVDLFLCLKESGSAWI